MLPFAAFTGVLMLSVWSVVWGWEMERLDESGEGKEKMKSKREESGKSVQRHFSVTDFFFLLIFEWSARKMSSKRDFKEESLTELVMLIAQGDLCAKTEFARRLLKGDSVDKDEAKACLLYTSPSPRD